MKKKLLLLTLSTGMLISSLKAQVASVQVIHNSADKAADTVDVWISSLVTGKVKLLSKFAFRTATPFVSAPAGTPLRVVVTPKNSTDTIAKVKGFTYNLAANAQYILVATGIVSASGYSPSSATAPFNLSVYTPAQQAATNSANTDVLVYHGATDAPTVSITSGTSTLIPSISYPQFNGAGYLQLPTANYPITVKAGSATVATYSAPLQTLGLGNKAITVLASGFLDPTKNSNGKAFGLWVALPSGGNLVELPLISNSSANIQVIHNSADKAADTVDVWISSLVTGKVKLLSKFAFRTATPFVSAPAGTPLRVVVTPKNSTDTIAKVKGFTYNLTANAQYILVASGIVSASGYTPSSTTAPFNLSVYTPAQQVATNSANTDVLVYHGATDAPTVSITSGTSTLIPSISYPQFNGAGYVQLPTANYPISVKAGSATVATYSAPLQTLGLGNKAITVLASGFLDPSKNSNGKAFGLWVALPTGGNLVELPLISNSTANIQVIHNSADNAADTVDVWISSLVTGKVKLLNKFAFRTATPFVSAPAGTPLRVVITPKNSTDTILKVKGFTYNLAANSQYILVASGIVSASGYTPSSITTPFNLNVYTPAQQAATNNANTDVLVYHGATDAPMVNIKSGTSTLIPAISYSQFNGAGYLQLPTADYPISVLSGTTIVETYSAPLQTLGLGNKAITVLASGFLDPSTNSNGKAFGLWVALPSGGNLVELPKFNTGILKLSNKESNLIFYPNPAKGNVTANVNSLVNETAWIKIMDGKGALVFETSTMLRIGKNNIQLNLAEMKSGIYFVQIIHSNQVNTGKLTIDN